MEPIPAVDSDPAVDLDPALDSNPPADPDPVILIPALLVVIPIPIPNPAKNGIITSLIRGPYKRASLYYNTTSCRYNMRQHLGTHRNGHWNASDIYKIDEDLRGFFLAKVRQKNHFI